MTAFPLPTMVHLLPNPLRVSSHLRSEPPRTAVPTRSKFRALWRYGGEIKVRSAVVVRCSSDYSSPITAAVATEEELIRVSEEMGENEYLAREFGWKVRKLIEEEDDLRAVARIQAEAFHEPVLLFNHFFFQFFQVLCPFLSLFLVISSLNLVRNFNYFASLC